MDFKLFITIFLTVFVAELGDKTQAAIFLYASKAAHPKEVVFAASASALLLASAASVLMGSVIAEHVGPGLVRWAGGLGFIAVGVWVLAAR